ncbi:MAG: PadR family transcriptional regulator [Sporolactobacillus sp.]
MNVQFKKGVLELCALVLIDGGDQYGYELAQRISRRIEVAEGTLYPLLRRLTTERYLTTYLSESAEGPVRKYYRMTEDGRTYKNALVKEWKSFAQAVDALIEEESQRHGE